jgi:hypothetical protein
MTSEGPRSNVNNNSDLNADNNKAILIKGLSFEYNSLRETADVTAETNTNNFIQVPLSSY